ncbi:SMP-30/gluconolactonase/LRE family protein [Candidatus Zixiibacteriota bacterium]
MRISVLYSMLCLALLIRPPAVYGQHDIVQWEISAPFPAAQLDVETLEYPNFFSLFMTQWQKVTAESGGLVDISTLVPDRNPDPVAIIGRATIFSEREQAAVISFGYSGEIALFANKRKVFQGTGEVEDLSRPAYSPGAQVERIELTLDSGMTELLVVLKSSSDTWMFHLQSDLIFSDIPRDHDRLVPVWETAPVFRIPESVLYDPDRELLYVSSYDRTQASRAGMGFLSRLSLEGEVIDLDWVEGLDGPCGMGLHDGRLYVVECVGNLVEIDTENGTVLNRYPVPDARFLNDLVIDDDGSIYLSDTSPPLGYTSLIYRFRDGRFEVWIDGMDIHRANGLFIHDGSLLVGSSGDCLFKSVDLETREITDIVALGGRVIDGIRVDREGNYLVTLWEGEAVLISPDGYPVEILSTRGTGRNLADAEFIKDLDLLIVPTFMGNTVVAWRLLPL